MTAVLQPPLPSQGAPGPRRFATMGEYVCRWIEHHCVFTKGRWRGQPFRLQEWQHRDILRLFEIDAETRLRRYRRALWGIPKKNGKTELGAALDCYLALGDDEPAPEIYCAANSDEQADLVFGAARVMCELSPTLSKLTERFAKEILFPDVAGKIKRLSAAVGTNDGLNVSGATFDELHEFDSPKSEEFYNVVTNGTGARIQPLIISITTAGHDLDTLCGRQYEYGKRVNAGEIDDPAFFFQWYEAPGQLDFRDSEAWRLANPSFGVTIMPAFYEDQLKDKPPAVFERYFLNRWTAVKAQWLPPDAWANCDIGPFDFDPLLPLFVGIDAATKHDTTAVVAGQWRDTVLRMKARIWERPLNAATGKPVDEWVLPMGEVEGYLRNLYTRHSVKAIGYDPAFITWTAQQLETEGLPMEEVPQTNARMVPAAQALYELTVQGRIGHDGDPLFARHIANAVAVQASGGDGGWRLKKGKARRPMDAAIAAAIVALLAQQPAEPPKRAPNLRIFGDDGEEIADA